MITCDSNAGSTNKVKYILSARIKKTSCVVSRRNQQTQKFFHITMHIHVKSNITQSVFTCKPLKFEACNVL